MPTDPPNGQTLFTYGGLPRVRHSNRGGTIREQWEAFHRDNPQVFDLLKRLSLQLKQKGHKNYSIKGLFEVVRWHYALQTKGDQDFKMNNNYTALYARHLMEEVPELDGFFRTRARRSA